MDNNANALCSPIYRGNNFATCLLSICVPKLHCSAEREPARSRLAVPSGELNFPRFNKPRQRDPRLRSWPGNLGPRGRLSRA